MPRSDSKAGSTHQADTTTLARKRSACRYSIRRSAHFHGLRVPHGGMTTLSNVVNRELDEQLAGRAGACGARYTRYCDDIVFSWRQGLGPPSDFEAGVRAILHALGY